VRIVPKLTLALVGCTCVILAINGAFRIRRERDFFEKDRARNHEMIGRSLAAAAEAVWRADGERAAIEAIGAVGNHFKDMRIRWVREADSRSLAVDAATLARMPTGQPVTRVTHDARVGDVSSTYVPLDVGGIRRGVIELSEPARSEREFLQSTVADTLSMTVSLAVASAVLAFVMGHWLVGTPVRLLMDKARRVGQGDFSEPLSLKRGDELSDLAREINGMCDQLVTTLAQLRHADRLSTVGKLASGVAHELGTPLNVVAARARMIGDGQTTLEESRQYAHIIVGATERMTKIIRQVLQFARRGTLQRTHIDLREQVNEAVDLLRPLADKRNVRLDVAPGDGGARFDADAAQIQQVVTNLTMNAIQAMTAGGIVRLSVRRVVADAPPEMARGPRECLCLDVQDEGPGIPPEDLPHLFEPFFTTKDVGEGTGLGLAVSHGIVREHNGWISVSRTSAAGTTFSVFLPIP